MKTAIIHYHLRTGGVRRVMDNTLRSLADYPVEIAVLTGEDAGEHPLPNETPCGLVPGLGYAAGSGPDAGRRLARELQAQARDLLGAPPDVWHVHNHSLGKNPVLPTAVRLLAEQGHPVLLQIHDFAEDGRPQLYRRLLSGCGDAATLGRVLYPVADNVHYALINSRDAGFVRDCGGPDGNTHLVPNPVGMEARNAPSPPASGRSGQPLVLYPTRAIRRKNIGELLLWACVAGGEMRFGLTRGPKNPVHAAVYDRWVALAAELGLPVEFGMGERKGVDFESLLDGAHAVITTSVTEGFGLCFLEPFLAGKPLCGRLLPDITSDFNARGIDLSNLYANLRIPLEHVGREVLEARVRTGMETSYRSYNRPLTPPTVQRAIGSFTQDGFVDFGRLDEPLQEHVIRQLARSGPVGMAPGDLLMTERGAVDRNRRAVETHWSLEVHGRRLMDVYERVAGSRCDGERIGSLDAARLLDVFLAPERFSLLKA